jgi:hypothetical protein
MVINTVVVGVVFCVAILVASGQVRRAIEPLTKRWFPCGVFGKNSKGLEILKRRSYKV